MTLADAVCAASGGSMLVGTGALVGAILRIRGTAAFVAAALVAMAATIVAISLALSLFSSYNRTAVLVIQGVVLILLAAVWAHRGRPSPQLYRPSLHELRKAATEHPSVAVLALAMIAAFAVEAVLAVGVVPNNYDSMYYHMSRVGYWLQNDSVFQFDRGTIYQLQELPNTEILQAWTMELTQGDRVAQLVQWLALVGLVCVIYDGARFLGFERASSLFAAAVFATLPLVVLQSSSTQSDLVAAFFVCAAVLFLARAIPARSAGDAIVGATALGVAIGARGTVLLALPGLALLGGAALWRWRPPFRPVASVSILLCVTVLLLGSVNYIENTLNTGSPLGDLSGWTGDREEAIPQASVKTLWNFVDLPGLGNLIEAPGGAVLQPVADLLADGQEVVWGEDYLTGYPDTAVHEDITAFGPIGLLILLPLLLFTLIRRGESNDRRCLAAVALSYIALYVFLVPVEPFDMRLMITSVALGAPLLARVAEYAWLRRLVVLVAVAFLLPSLFFNQQKPLHPGDFALTEDSAAQRAGANVAFEPILRNVSEALSGRTRVGFVGSDSAWDYPLFGPKFDRYVVRLPRDVNGKAEALGAMRANHLEAIVWGEVGRPKRLSVRPLGNGPHGSYWIALEEKQHE